MIVWGPPPATRSARAPAAPPPPPDEDLDMSKERVSVRVELSCLCGASLTFEAISSRAAASMIGETGWAIDAPRYAGGTRLAGTCPRCRKQTPSPETSVQS